MFGLWSSPEYNRLKKLASRLKAAVEPNIEALSNDLLSNNIITGDTNTRLINRHVDANFRAAELVNAVLNKVSWSPQDYWKFLSILKGNEDFYRDIIRELERPLSPTPWRVEKHQYLSSAIRDVWNSFSAGCNSPRLILYSFILTITMYILCTTYPILFTITVAILVLLIVLVAFG